MKRISAFLGLAALCLWGLSCERQNWDEVKGFYVKHEIHAEGSHDKDHGKKAHGTEHKEGSPAKDH